MTHGETGQAANKYAAEHSFGVRRKQGRRKRKPLTERNVFRNEETLQYWFYVSFVLLILHNVSSVFPYKA